MRRFFVIVLLFCVVLCGCGGGGSQPQTPLPSRSVALDQEFTLCVGQNARLEAEGLTVTLRAVPEDSRCPEDAQCAWEGNARVLVELKTTSNPDATVELNTSLSRGSREAVHPPYAVRLVSVLPNQRANRTIKADEYTVGLLIKKL